MALGRSLSMGTLINEGILDPGEKVLTFDYMVGELSIQTFCDGTCD